MGIECTTKAYLPKMCVSVATSGITLNDENVNTGPGYQMRTTRCDNDIKKEKIVKESEPLKELRVMITKKWTWRENAA